MTNDRSRRYHYAVSLTKVRGGWRADMAIERRSRGEADISSRRLLAEYGHAEAITLDREIQVARCWTRPR